MRHFPKYATIIIRKKIKIDYGPGEFDKEHYEREGYTQEELENSLEYDIRDSVWEYINDNDIKIEFD